MRGAFCAIAEQRQRKRVKISVPILARDQNGEEEIAKTEDVSTDGLRVSLMMNLKRGDVLTVMCPYTHGGINIGERAEVQHRSIYPFNERFRYGFRYIR